MTYLKSAWVVLLCMLVSATTIAQTSLHGHIYSAETRTPCGDAIIQAWPCGNTFSSDAKGAFNAECSSTIDSVTVNSYGFKTVTVQVDGKTHLDIALVPLSVDLSEITVSTLVEENTIVIAPTEDLMQTLDKVPGIRTLDLGAGLLQPILRGMVGSRVAILEDGVPQVGGRWGKDHGVLSDPVLYDGMEWAPGGGRVWLGPEAVGGGLRFASIKMLEADGSNTQVGASLRIADSNAKVYTLHKQRKQNWQWHLGLSTSQFADRNVPQPTFEYLNRVYEIPEGRLPNTSGTALHSVAGLIYSSDHLGQITLEARHSNINQGLFPGIVGVPSQDDLAGDGDKFSVQLPNQNAKRTLISSKWIKPGTVDRTIRLAYSFNERRENAPPHAHGYGSEPDSDLSLSLLENHIFAESKWEGYHGAWGVQAESLRGSTGGWEFLLPNHYRDRISVIADYRLEKSTVSARADLISTGNDAYTEPLYSIENEVIGEDVRAIELHTVMPSWALSYYLPFERDKVEYSLTATAYSRAPSNYALAANGIHHGTFRFEQGNPELKPETAVEARFDIEKEAENFNLVVQSFVSLHKGFIHLTPTSSFAPIAHAGQIYSFEAADAFRSGLEMTMNFKIGKGQLTTAASLIGQWDLETGLGLPFTPPADIINTYSLPVNDRLTVACSHRAIAPSYITARNEDYTEGASLFGLEIKHKLEAGELKIEADNLLNTNWLDHTSAYRAVGLVAQGRWISVAWSKTLNN